VNGATKGAVDSPSLEHGSGAQEIEEEMAIATPPSSSNPFPAQPGLPPAGDPTNAGDARRATTAGHGRRGLVGAAILISAGLLLLVQNLYAPGWDLLWPVALICVGVAIGLQPFATRQPLHYARSFWAMAFVAIGSLFLLAEFGYFDGWQFQRLGDLWPLLLVLIGVELLVTRSLPRRTAAVAGAAIALVTLVGGLFYVAFGPAVVPGGISSTASAGVGELQSATLDVNVGAATVTINGDADAGQLYAARYRYNNGEGATTNLNRATGIVRIDMQARTFLPGQGRGRSVALSLNPEIPWKITVSGGATSQVLDLSRVKVSQLTINGGAQQITITLPPASGNVPVVVNAGAASVTIHRPVESAASVTMSGGVNDLTADGDHRSTLAGVATWQSSEYATAANRYSIRVSGGANHVVLDAQ